MDRFGIVHLSDTQFGNKHFFGYPSRLARALVDDVQHVADRGLFTPLYVLVSGDITETGHFDEFKDALAQFEILGRQLSVDRESFLCVPGNHDVSWPLAKVAREAGNIALKYGNYNAFVHELTGSDRIAVSTHYPVINDHRFGTKFLLLNSTERETDSCHDGYVDEVRLIESLERDHAQIETQKYVKICILHHRLDTTVPEPSSRIVNALDIETVLAQWGYSAILTGHVHQSINHVVTKDDAPLIYSGCGSAGVDKTQRADGVQLQYSLHVIDRRNGTFETHWRAFNPQSKTRHGLGGWTRDASGGDEPVRFGLPIAQTFTEVKKDVLHDPQLEERVGIRANPFLYSNAEKIAGNLILKLFVSDESRHKGASRLTGDAIIRGPRGSGKTMFLRYLRAFGNETFRQALREKRTAECLPVFVNLSRIHRVDLTTPVAAYTAAENLIYEAVIAELDTKVQECQSAEFRAAVFAMKQRLAIFQQQSGTPISKLGKAIHETLGAYFGHVLLLIDELATVFPRSFFADRENGFIAWMNSIRNSGPYSTRLTVYPTDVSDILNEERFGLMVNLEYQVRMSDEYEQFRTYSRNIIDRYLASVSVDRAIPATIDSIIATAGNPSDDALEQLVYAADGSSRRMLSLMDRCLMQRVAKAQNAPLTKAEVLSVIKEMANNLLTGYSATERELAGSIAKACKRQSTFRFRMPNQSVMLRPLYASREEFNIVRLIEPKAGARGSTYEFAYPYCIAMDVQTHYVRDTSRVCVTRDRHSGEWITKITTVEKESWDVFSGQARTHGTVVQLDDSSALIEGAQGSVYVAELIDLAVTVGDRVTFLTNEDGAAFDVLVIGPGET
jgi:3',5'-cyclic AMP phosphodiesterase CpdA